jgi:hypothetical protein
VNVREVLAAAAIGVSALAATAAVAAQQPATAAISAAAPAATAAPAAQAQQPAAADHLWFRLDPVSLGGGWKLRANATSPDYYLTLPSIVSVTPAEIISVRLDRRLSRRADESHVAAVHLAEASIAFDGRDGRWATRGTAPQSGGSPPVEKVFAVDMTIKTVGEPEQLGPGGYLPWSCRGPSLARVRVTLTGSFALRTGMARFKTIRRAHLTGTITYNQGGPLECGQPAPTKCEPTTYLSSQYDTRASASRGIRALLSIDRGRRFLSLQLTDPTGWTHVMTLHELDVFSGQLPTIRGRLPANLPLRGSFSFVAKETADSVDGACRTTTTKGFLTGTLRVSFTGWETRDFLRRPWRLNATYRVSVPL